jgi:hypothetical protein
MSYQQKLKRLMKTSNVAAISREAGLTPRTVWRSLCGSIPSVQTTVCLARVLGVDVGWLVDDTRDWPPVRVTPSMDAEVSAAVLTA